MDRLTLVNDATDAVRRLTASYDYELQFLTAHHAA